MNKPQSAHTLPSHDMQVMLAQHTLFARGHAGKRLEMRLQNLSGIKLNNFDLSQCLLLACNLSYTDLEGCSFQAANLSNSLFIGANLKHCDFTRADLRGTRFYKSDLQQAKMTGSDMRVGSITLNSGGVAKQREFTTDLSFCNMEEATLQDAVLHNVRLRGVNMRNADLSGADLSGADMQGVVLLGAQMERAKFTGANIKNAVFTVNDDTRRLFAGNPAFEEHLSNLRETDRIVAAHEEWVNSGGRSGSRADFAGMALRGVDLRGRELSAVSFRGADLTGAKLAHARLAAADFNGATLAYAELSNADLRGAGMENARLLHTLVDGADFGDLDLRGGGKLAIRFAGASIEWTSFAQCVITPEQLSGAVLRECRMPEEP
ncbi:hypothetical protein CHU95_16390 [Niveispirillum lacus]|uniref:Low-complexity protein n=1 Tax=Niveispirillum lacus TaxID=1981099 RepID=A0A255YT74_9PROT|nr:pentapeptide repeat-containing protein [Niveispirillum lacus]OYQ32381.1 hypothetical protein CHU95_16390 [Niveispirillum lacus]